MEKTAFLKVRLDPEMKEEFESICGGLGTKPSEEVRAFVASFIERELKKRGARVQVRVTRPNGYEYGAWRVEVKLNSPHDSRYPLVFPLPMLEKRAVQSDPEYFAAWFNSDKRQHESGGLIINGIWRGVVRTNGVDESNNPTSMEAVEAEFVDIIEGLLALRTPNIS
jgi:hypothetical protein